ncbi:MAG: phosphate signaling complex protein PhoU [Silvibacterium sp.]
MPRIHFHQQLAELKDKLLAMAALSQQAMEAAVEAYLQRDSALCQYVRENETAINAAQREVDEMAYDLLAKEQPMAIDLRFILAVIKINGDLERIGDQAMSIALRTLTLLEDENIDLPVDIYSMGGYAARMIRTSIQALLDGDAQLAESVVEMDDEIDHMNHIAHAELVKVIQARAEVAAQALQAIIISRNLERIADHAANIATDVIFWVRGADVRHQLNAPDS